ncbi:hypothetical protein [Nocardia sp. NPDC127526]|uniref:hypothetical protein n=1 Tax=Nocardia sp. NPDC127526 TaxID=3345393 RepID=UPI00362D8230
MDFGNNTGAPNNQPYEPYPTAPVYPQTPHHDPYGYHPYSHIPPHPTTMPGSVRAARIISWLFAALGIGLSVLAGVIGNPELAGALVAGLLPALFLALFAFGYTTNGNGMRVASIICAAFGILWSLGGAAQGLPPGLLGIAANLTILILLSKQISADWFKRPH